MLRPAIVWRLLTSHTTAPEVQLSSSKHYQKRKEGGEARSNASKEDKAWDKRNPVEVVDCLYILTKYSVRTVSEHSVLSAALHWTNVLHCICVIQSAARNRKTFLRAVRSFNIVCAYLNAIEIPIIGPPLYLSTSFKAFEFLTHAWKGWITFNYSVYFAVLAVFSLKFSLHLTVTSYMLTTVGSLLSQTLSQAQGPILCRKIEANKKRVKR